MKNLRSWSWMTTGSLAVLLVGGCPNTGDIKDILDDLEINIDQSVNTVQTTPPTAVVLPDRLVDDGDTIIIDADATFITDVSSQLVIEELPDITLIGFENLTGLDAYYQYFADGEFQGIFVFDGETLLIEYPCLSEIEIISEEYFDPFTGEFIEDFSGDLSGAVFFSPDDFDCGDVFFISFSEEDIVVEALPIDSLE